MSTGSGTSRVVSEGPTLEQDGKRAGLSFLSCINSHAQHSICQNLAWHQTRTGGAPLLTRQRHREPLNTHTPHQHEAPGWGWRAVSQIPGE